MFAKNEGGPERIIRLLLGLSLVLWGYWTSGIYWLDYQVLSYPVSCWDWDNFITHSCIIDRGIIITAIGCIPLLTGLIGWCPLKAIFIRKPKVY